MLTIRELIKTLYNAFVQKLKKHRGNWEQNDPTADDYIKNRPFYIDGYTSIIKNKTFEAFDNWCEPFTFKPIMGEIYKVIWDGKEYECIAYLDSQGDVCIGNEGLVEDTKDTGEPFYYYYKNYEVFGLYVKNTGTHTISINKLNVKKIDKKFIDVEEDFVNKLNRTTAVSSPDNNYTTYMARGTSLNNTETDPIADGTIAWTYE